MRILVLLFSLMFVLTGSMAYASSKQASSTSRNTVTAYKSELKAKAEKKQKEKKQKEKNQKKVKELTVKYMSIYMFGVSTSFTDSTVYVTDVQVVDSAYFVGKHILGGCKEYSDQLAAYLNGKNIAKRTNAVFFKKKRKDAEKAFVKLRRRYTKAGVEMLSIPTGEFIFKGVTEL